MLGGCTITLANISLWETRCENKGDSCIPALVFCRLLHASAWANLSCRTTLFLGEIWCKGSFSVLLDWSEGPWQPVHTGISQAEFFPFFICLEYTEPAAASLFSLFFRFSQRFAQDTGQIFSVQNSYHAPMTNRLFHVLEMESFSTRMLNRMQRPTGNASTPATMGLPTRYLIKYITVLRCIKYIFYCIVAQDFNQTPKNFVSVQKELQNFSSVFFWVFFFLLKSRLGQRNELFKLSGELCKKWCC